MTLNQFVNIFRNFTTSHEQLNGFFVGDSDKFALNKSQRYPVLLMDIDPSTVNELTKTFKARFIVLDRATSLEQVLEVQSDTELICSDIIAVLNNIVNTTLTLPIDINHYEGATQTNDLLAGSFFDIALEVFSPLNACDVPSDVAPEFSNGAFVVDQDGNILATLYPGQRFTAQELRDIIDTIDSNTTTVIDPIT